MLITEEYRALNAELHQRNPAYGISGHRWKAEVAELIRINDYTSLLDYGSGKGTLRAAFPSSFWDRGFLFMEYDPAIPEKSSPPSQADLVVCTDVLEHIEPDCLNAVLDDLRRVTRRAVFLEIHTALAQKTLADGRNAHLIVEPAEWWLGQLRSRWTLHRAQIEPLGFTFVGKPL